MGVGAGMTTGQKLMLVLEVALIAIGAFIMGFHFNRELQKPVVVLVMPPHISNRVPPIEPEPELGPQLDQGQFNRSLPSQE